MRRAVRKLSSLVPLVLFLGLAVEGSDGLRFRLPTTDMLPSARGLGSKPRVARADSAKGVQTCNAPTAVASGGGTIEPGGSIALSGSGGVSCLWSPAIGLDDNTSCSPMASPPSTTSYAPTVVDDHGCASTNETSVTVVVGASMITEYPLPDGFTYLEDIVTGPDGALWFTEGANNKVGKITTGGVINQYSDVSPNSDPNGITAGPDGTVWFTELNGVADPHIGRIDTSGAITEFVYSPDPNNAWNIVSGPDGNLWFTVYNSGQIGRMTPAGAVTLFPAPYSGSGPLAITSGPAGALWYTELDLGEIVKVTTAGEFTAFPIPTAGSHPFGITVGPDGALWFTEYSANQIGRMTTDGVFTEFPVPIPGEPWNITAGPDGNLWFTDTGAAQVGRITTDGVVTEFSVPSGNAPRGITAGPDGAVWFVERGGFIGRIALGPVASFTASPNPSACGQTVAFDATASYHQEPNRRIVSYAWAFGDAASGSGVTASHTYTAFGIYTATLTVTDDNVPPKTATASTSISVNQGNHPPVAAAGGPYVATLANSFTLDGTGSSDPDAGCGDFIAS